MNIIDFPFHPVYCALSVQMGSRGLQTAQRWRKVKNPRQVGDLTALSPVQPQFSWQITCTIS